MINLRNIIIAGIAGTAAKTLFSYALSFIEEKQLKVPEILGTMLTGQTTTTKNTSKSAQVLGVGYAAHIATGIAFTACYDLLWRSGIGKPNLKYGALFGGVNGLVGTFIWVGYLYLHPRPPKVPLRSYIRDLLINHVLFGVTIARTYQLMDKKGFSTDKVNKNEAGKNWEKRRVQDTGREPKKPGSYHGTRTTGNHRGTRK